MLPAERLVRIPDGVDDDQAAALMLKGLTAQMLLRQIYRVRKGDTLLVHAAAGGVGSILVQWAKHLGATVIAVVGSAAKAERARELGADHVLLSGEDWVAQTKAITAESRRRRRLRLGRQGHVHRLARLPASARPDGDVRQRFRTRRRRWRRSS